VALTVAVALAVMGVMLVSAGAGLWNVSAGMVLAGVQCIGAAYVVMYMKARAPR
jgi:hypothetical protein